MLPIPMPDDGQGPRTFTVNGVQWRAVEVRSSNTPGLPPILVVSGDNAHYERQTFPPRWRTLPADALLAVVQDK
jgi:hypothetical protein